MDKSKHSDSEKSANKTIKGKKLAKRILMVAGGVALTAAVISVISSNGSSDKWLDISRKHSNLKPKFYELTKEQKRRQDYKKVESDVMLWASDKEHVPETIRWLKNKYIYLVRNNFDGSFTAMSRKKAPGTFNGLSERDFNEKTITEELKDELSKIKANDNLFIPYVMACLESIEDQEVVLDFIRNGESAGEEVSDATVSMLATYLDQERNGID